MKTAVGIGIVAAWFDGAVHLAANAGLVAVLWYGGNQIGSGALSAGDLTSFLMYSLYTGFNLGNLSRVYSDLKRASGVAGRIYEIADTPGRIPLSAKRPGEFWAQEAGALVIVHEAVGLARELGAGWIERPAGALRARESTMWAKDGTGKKVQREWITANRKPDYWPAGQMGMFS
jgi:ABC-type multidrug transport system fused ATPase/permease subunit